MDQKYDTKGQCQVSQREAHWCRTGQGCVEKVDEEARGTVNLSLTEGCQCVKAK